MSIAIKWDDYKKEDYNKLINSWGIEESLSDWSSVNIKCPKCGNLIQVDKRTVLVSFYENSTPEFSRRFRCLKCGWEAEK